MIIHGENLEVMFGLESETIDFAYLDPPFFTQKDHRIKGGRLAFYDKWQSLESFIEQLEYRVIEVRRLLKSHGSMVLHLDPKTSHYAKVMCDRIFGIECFASEVIWRYRRWPSKTKNFQRVHDVMLRYVKDQEGQPRFNQLYEPPSVSTLRSFGTKKQMAVGKGDARKTSITEEESPGVPLGDVWDIGIIAPIAKERTGYPTQKPEALLERWIESCTEHGDMVLDPYMGSGTTICVADKLGRNSIGIDSSDVAVEIARDRTPS